MRISGILALALFACASSPAFALQPPEPRELHELEVRHSDLWWGNVYRSVNELPAELTQDLVPELGRLNVHPERAFLDIRTGRWGTLIITRPLIPGTGVENDLQWADLGLETPRNEQERAQAAGIALRSFLSEFSDELGLKDQELAEPRVGAHSERLIQAHIPRQRNGIPVRDSYVTASINSGNLVLMGQRNWGDIDVETRPSIESDLAIDILAQYLGQFDVHGFRESPRLEIIPVSGQPDVSQVARVGQGLDFRLVWVLSPEFRDDIGTWEALVDAHNGELLSFEDTNHYHADDGHSHDHHGASRAQSRGVIGGVLPVGSDGEPPGGVEQPGYPMPFADVSLDGSSVGFTTTGGNSPSGSGGGTLSTTLSGQYSNISDNCGAVNETGDSGDLDLGDGAGIDCSVPPGSSAGNTASARTTFYGVNRIKEQARGYLPDNSWLDQPLNANMNINNNCNATWNGTSINFFTSGNGCGNTGEIMAVIHHEWGHGMDANSVNPGISSPGEGIADIYAQNMLNDSCIGRGFFNEGTCGGFGDPCTECTGVRDSDFAKHQSGEPHDIDWAISACGSGSNTPCGGAVHCEGSIVAEAVWDLAHRDLQGFEDSNFDFDLNTALELTTRLTYLGAGPVGTWFQCNPGDGSGGGCNADSGYLQYLAADADDGSIENGTPHMSAIHAAYDRHQLACDTPTVQDSGCSGGPEKAPENLEATTFSEGVELSWDSVDDATEYWIFRAEGPMGCDFGKALVGQTTGTEFTETGLRNNFEVYYSVLAVGANDACTSPMSECKSVTPLVGPSGILEGQVLRGGSQEPLEGVLIEAQGDDMDFTTETDGNGQFSITALEGLYTVTASRDGFVSASQPDLNLEEGETLVLEFTLDAPSANISPDSFELSVGQGGTGQAPLEFSNEGTADLDWTIATDIVEVSGTGRGFAGDFDIDNWELVNSPSGVGGSVEIEDGPPIEVFLTGGDDGTGGDTDFEIEIPTDGTITFDWGYQSTDSGCWDSGGYAINGDFTELACNQDAVPYFEETETVEVSAGDLFAFRVNTDDGQLGPGVLGVTNFEFSPDICGDFSTVPWLSASPDTGVTSPGETDAADIMVDTSDLDQGDYEAFLCIDTNDPDLDRITVPVELTVTDEKPGGVPEADISPSSFAFSIEEGSDEADTLLIGNTGEGSLNWNIDTAEDGSSGIGQSYGFISDTGPVTLPVGYDRSSNIQPDGQAPAQVSGAVQPQAIDEDFEEGFEDVSDLPDSGWTLQNNSDPQGSTGWFQGNTVTFDAHEGPDDSYIAANFTNAEIGGTISNWLLTPEFEFNDGTEIVFWTRTSEDPDFADRLEVRLSDQGSSDDVGSGAEDVGDFTVLLEEVNPDEDTGGYPQEWTQFTLELDETFEGQTGRIGFRYYLPDTTNTGNYIGIDTFSVTQPDDNGTPPTACDDPVGIDWLSATPDSGTTGEDSTSEVEIQVDGSDLAPGDYSALLCVFTNDPDAELVEIPVDLEVTQSMNPQPELDSIDPDSVVSGSEEFELVATGSDFVSDSVIRWDGTDLDTSFVDETELTATIPADELEEPASIAVTVFTPEPGGGESDSQTFTIDQATGTLEGTVMSLGHCGDHPAAAAGADIEIVGQLDNYSATADDNGDFQIELPVDESPIEVSASAADHISQTTSDVEFGTDDTVTVDFDLVLEAPCATADPQEFDLVLVVSESETYALALGNEAGAIDLEWSIELADGADTCSTAGPVDWLAVNPASGTTPAGEADEVSVEVDTDGLEEGSHEAWICVDTDDEETGMFEIPVSLNVLDMEIFRDRFEAEGGD